MKPTEPHTAKIKFIRVYKISLLVLQRNKISAAAQEEGPRTSIKYKNSKVLLTYVAFKDVRTSLMFIINEQDLLLTIIYINQAPLYYVKIYYLFIQQLPLIDDTVDKKLINKHF